jgi:hypothetical protein
MGKEVSIFFSTIKDGIQTVHRNWYLLVIQFSSLVLSCLSFFVIVGIPVLFAFVMLGIDLTEVFRYRTFFEAFKGTTGLLYKYFGMAIVILISLFLYLFSIIALWIFVLSGTIGTLKRSIVDTSYKLNLRSFITEGKIFFVPVFFFISVIVLIFIVFVFILGFLGSAASTIIESAKAQELTLALFLGVFFSLIIISIGFFLIITILSLIVYGMAYLSFNLSRNPFVVLKETILYIYNHPSAMGFYTILLLGYIIVGFLVILISSPFAFIPVIGPFLSMPLQIFIYIFQVYTGLIILSSIFHYYKNTAYPITESLSIGHSDTSRKEEIEQASSQKKKEETL